MKANFKNIIELIEYFKTEEICTQFLKSIVWKDGKKCPHCGGCDIMEYSNYKRNRCESCKKDFSIKQGTIFQDSNVPLKKWFMAMYIFNAHKKGISSLQLGKDISVSQPTAWFMLQRLRFASKNLFKQEFQGTVEIDEAYIGGNEANRHLKDKKTTGIKEKSVIIGMVNRDTKQVKAFKVLDSQKEHLLPKINMNVKNGSIIMTDTLQAYKGLKKNYNHKTIKHSANEYYREEKNKDGKTAYKVHTNTIEGYWSLLKRGIDGTYHWVSKKHIQKYCNEFSFRYNTRNQNDVERFELFCNNLNGKLLYKTLTA